MVIFLFPSAVTLRKPISFELILNNIFRVRIMGSTCFPRCSFIVFGYSKITMNIFNRRVGMHNWYVVKHILCYQFLFCFIVMKFEDKQSITIGYVYFHDCFHFSMRRSSCYIWLLLSITTRQHNFWRKNFTFSRISMLICMITFTKVSTLMVIYFAFHKHIICQFVRQ